MDLVAIDAFFIVSNNNWKTVVTSTATINTTAWNFIALEWKVVAGSLQFTLYLNANNYVGTIASYKDFTGLQVSVKELTPR